MPHDTVTSGFGHNRSADHLGSHIDPGDAAAELQVLTEQFIDGWRQAVDKTAYLRLAAVPFERPGRDGAAVLKLVDVRLTSEWQVGTASPGFGTRELAYLPFPGEMVRERTNMALIYVSADETESLDLRAFLASRLPAGA